MKFGTAQDRRKVTNQYLGCERNLQGIHWMNHCYEYIITNANLFISAKASHLMICSSSLMIIKNAHPMEKSQSLGSNLLFIRYVFYNQKCAC